MHHIVGEQCAALNVNPLCPVPYFYTKWDDDDDARDNDNYNCLHVCMCAGAAYFFPTICEWCAKLLSDCMRRLLTLTLTLTLIVTLTLILTLTLI